MHTNNNRISTPAIIRQSAVENVPDMWMPLDLNISHVNIFGKDTVIPPQFSTGSAQNVGIHNMQVDGLTASTIPSDYGSNSDLVSGFHSPAFSDNFSLVLQGEYRKSNENDCLAISSGYYLKNCDSNSSFVLKPGNMVEHTLPYGGNPNSNLDPISQILGGLSSDVPDEATRASYNLYKILKTSRSNVNYGDFRQLSAVLVSCMNTHISNPAVLRSCAAAIYYLSLNKEFIPIIYESKLLEIFIRIDNNQSNGLLYCLISTIHTIFLKVSSSRKFLSDTANLSKFLVLLKHPNDRFLAVLTDCICICFIDIDANFLAQKTDFLSKLLIIFRLKNYEKLIYNSCRIVKELSTSSVPKTVIVQSGALSALTKLLLHVSRRIAVISLVTIRNLSDVASLESNHEELINILTRFVFNQFEIPCRKEGEMKVEEHLISSTLGILANITCNNPYNKQSLISKGFVPILVKICSTISNKEIVESAVATLRHLTCRNPMSVDACQALYELNGLPIITNIINRYSSSPMINSANLKKVLFGLIANFVTDPKYLNQIRDLKITQLTAHTMASVIEEIKKNSGGKSLPPGVKYYTWMLYFHNCQKLLEVCLLVLYLMSLEASAFDLMSSSPILISLFSKLLLSTTGTSLTYLLNILSVISGSSKGLDAIENSFLSIHQNEICLNSSTDNICIERLKEICSIIKPSSNIHSTLSTLFSNLNKTTLASSFEILSYNSLSSPKEANMESNMQGMFGQNLASLVDSPLTMSPTVSHMYNGLERFTLEP